MKLMDKSGIAAAIAAVVAMGASGVSQAAHGAGIEKCAGIAAAGKNDCGTSMHTCAGMSKSDRDPLDWVKVPKGTCQKIAGGTVTTDPSNKHGGGMAK